MDCLRIVTRPKRNRLNSALVIDRRNGRMPQLRLLADCLKCSCRIVTSSQVSRHVTMVFYVYEGLAKGIENSVASGGIGPRSKFRVARNSDPGSTNGLCASGKHAFPRTGTALFIRRTRGLGTKIGQTTRSGLLAPNGTFRAKTCA